MTLNDKVGAGLKTSLELMMAVKTGAIHVTVGVIRDYWEVSAM